MRDGVVVLVFWQPFQVATTGPSNIVSKGIRMKLGLTIVGGLLSIVGLVWILQGINVLPGSFMTGQTKWAVIGAFAFVAGLAVLYAARRGPRR
jgi:uncharacterized integral membrane protein